MEVRIPEYMTSYFNASKEAFCDTLHNPSLWSEKIVRRTLERAGAQAFNFEDVQHIIKDYLTVLAESIRKGETL